MSWYTKVAWTEGLFLRPHHFQQSDRYHEHLLESRVRATTPYPWGFSHLEIDRDLAQQSKFALRRAAGVMPDGTPFDMPEDSPLPPPIVVPDNAAQQIAWLSMPVAAANTREADDRESDSAARFVIGSETFIDSTSPLRLEEEVDIAFPRLGFELRKTAKPGYISLGLARVLEVRDKQIVFDEKYIPPLLLCGAHPVVAGWIDRVIGWIENRLDELARYAADPTAGGGLQSVNISFFSSSTGILQCSSTTEHRATCTRNGCSTNSSASSANSQPSQRRSGAHANIRSTTRTTWRTCSGR